MDEQVYMDPEVGKVRFVRSSRGRRLTVSVHPVRGVRVSIPYFVTCNEALRFYNSKRDWVIATAARQKEKVGEVVPVSAEMVEAMWRQARVYLPERLAWFAERYGFKYNRVFLKNNVSNWGSCSTKDNINLNVRLMMLPEYLRDYVLLHELSHLRHHDHSRAFHALLEKLCVAHFDGRLPEGLRISKAAMFPLSHALVQELHKYHTYSVG